MVPQMNGKISLASRKLDPDDDSENDFPNTIEDANKNTRTVKGYFYIKNWE